MRIAVLTSSRADYGIYKPLLKKLSLREDVMLFVIAFGMHLQKQHGHTIDVIKKDAFGEIHEVEGMPNGDTLQEISAGYGNLITSFASYWDSHSYDVVLALGDRFEMSAAVQAGIPFKVNFAHIHGGETTTGATDNIYRHQISLASSLHFVAADAFKTKVQQITGTAQGIHNVGALSLDGMENLELPTWNTVRERFNLPDKKFILVTIHPETMNIDQNVIFSEVAFEVLGKLSEQYHIVVTLPNADAMGSLYREQFSMLKEKFSGDVSLIESFGKENYFAAMLASEFLLGNTSSGIIEAASFRKYVVNLGERQGGRLRSENVFDVPFDIGAILNAVRKIENAEPYDKGNNYYKENTANKIIEILTENGL